MEDFKTYELDVILFDFCFIRAYCTHIYDTVFACGDSIAGILTASR